MQHFWNIACAVVLFLCLAFSVAPQHAKAQLQTNFQPCKSGQPASLSATTTSTGEQLQSCSSTTLFVMNFGPSGAYVHVDPANVAAVVGADQLVPSGTCAILSIAPNYYVSAITQTGTASLILAQGTGSGCPGTGGAGSVGQVNSSVVTGQVIIATTGTAVQLASNALVNGIVIKAKSTNNSACGTVGSSSVTNAYTGSGTGYGICPGEAASFAVNNSNILHVSGTAGDIFTFEGN